MKAPHGEITDLPTGPITPKSTVLSAEDEAVIVAFRKHRLLPLDDCLCALQATLTIASRSAGERLGQDNIRRIAEAGVSEPLSRSDPSSRQIGHR